MNDELKDLRDQLDAVQDALDYLHGLTPEQANSLRKDAERYRLNIESIDMSREAFRQGARAFFDHLMCRAANNYHGNPELQRQCDQDNKLIEEWAADALEAVSPEDFGDWRAINDAHQKGVEVGFKQAWQAAQADAFERAAKICDRLSASNAPASHCALVIRALAKEPTR